MKLYLIKILGSSAHKVDGVLGSWGGGVAKMFENIFLENDGYREQNLKWKTPKKLQSSSHKWVLGEILQKLQGCLGKNRECNVFVLCVCYGLHLPRKEGKVKILHLPPKKNTQALRPAT